MCKQRLQAWCRTGALAVLLLLGGTWASGLGFAEDDNDAGQHARGAATPEALYARAMRANATGDADEMLACTRSDAHPLLVLMAAYGLGFEVDRKIRNGGDRAKLLGELRGLYERNDAGTLEGHRFPHYDNPLALADYAIEHFRSVDARAFLADALKLRRAWSPERAGEQPSTALRDLRIAGDHAVGYARGGPVRFARKKGRWFLDGPVGSYEPLGLYLPGLRPKESSASQLLGWDMLELGVVEHLKRHAVAPRTSAMSITRPAALGRFGVGLMRAPSPSLAPDLAAHVPAADTFALTQVQVAPDDLIQVLLEPEPQWRRLVDENLRAAQIEGGLAGLSKRLTLTGHAAVAFRRRPEVFDEWAPQEYYDAGPDWDEAAALTLLFRLEPGRKAQWTDAALRLIAPLLGCAAGPLEHQDTAYWKSNRGDRWPFPLGIQAVAIAGDLLLVSTSERSLKQTIDTIVDPKAQPPLATTERYVRATASLRSRPAHTSLWVDLAALVQTPAATGVTKSPGGYLWDRRLGWVHEEKDPRKAAAELHKRAVEKIRAEHGRAPTPKEMESIFEATDAFTERFMARLPEFLEEYRTRLAGLSGLRSLYLTHRAGQHVVQSSLLLLADVETNPAKR